MKKLLIILFISLINIINSQDEKHLALVIGNANYDKGALKNPVNDAELFARTLDSLNFDVIVKTNLESRSEFIRAIREFGQIRAEYDVAFVYYAGHGIQVDNENFLLPTKEEFLSEDDVLDFGVSVQNVLRYLESESEKVNILILDACRDNPFEVKWNATRSLKGNGLAKIPPPTGSLIAFSTDAGSTAADGESENSVYCKSLCKNFLLEDVSIDQVFRNVRSDVLNITNKRQRPVESSQLTGNTFYVNPKSMIDDIIIVNELYNNFKYKEAFSELEKRFKNFTASPKLIELHINLLLKLKMEEEALTLLDSYLENNDFLELKSFLAYKVNAELKNFEVARKHIEKALYFDSLNSDYISKESYLFYRLLEDNQAKKNIKKNILKIKFLNSQNENINNSFNLAFHYYLIDDIPNFISSVNDVKKRDRISSHNLKNLIKYSEYYGINAKLLKDSKIDQSYYRINIHDSLINYAIEKFPNNYLFYLEKMDFLGDEKKINFLIKSLEIYPNNELALVERAMYYYNLSNDCFDKDGEFENLEFDELKCKEIAYNAISDLKYLNENTNNEDVKKRVLQTLGLTYLYLMHDSVKAIDYFENIIDDDTSEYWRLYNWLANSYGYSNYTLALKNYDLAIKNLKSTNQKKYYNENEYNIKLAGLYAHKFQICKFNGLFEDSYQAVKESFRYDSSRRQYDIIEMAIVNNDLEFAIKTSNEVFKVTTDTSFKILSAIAHVKKGNIEKGDSIFLNYIKSPNIAYLVNKKARIKRVFNYCSQFYFLRNNYEKAIDYIIKWNEWLSEKSDKLNPSNFYLLAYSYFNNQNYIEAYVSIEKAIIGLPNLSLFQLDETFYIPLSEEKIYELKKKIISKLNNK